MHHHDPVGNLENLVKVLGNDQNCGTGFCEINQGLADALGCPGIDTLDLFEADSRALDCARANLSNFSSRTRFHWHDVTTGLPGTYDAIVMNPPFHTGQATDVDLGPAFLKVASDSLRRGGKLLLVANRQLPYEAGLEVNGFAWRKIAESPIYKVLHADKR